MCWGASSRPVASTLAHDRFGLGEQALTELLQRKASWRSKSVSCCTPARAFAAAVAMPRYRGPATSRVVRLSDRSWARLCMLRSVSGWSAGSFALWCDQRLFEYLHVTIDLAQIKVRRGQAVLAMQCAGVVGPELLAIQLRRLLKQWHRAIGARWKAMWAVATLYMLTIVCSVLCALSLARRPSKARSCSSRQRWN